jgi:hypothetical protein
MRDEPAIECDPDGAHDDDLHDVAQEHVRAAQQAHAEPGEREPLDEPAAEHRDDLDGEDGEAPEDEEVHPAGRLLVAEELLLPEGVDEHGPDALRDAVEAGRRLRGPQHEEAPVERAAEPAEAGGEREREHEGVHRWRPLL